MWLLTQHGVYKRINSIGPDGARALSEALLVNQSLSVLNLEYAARDGIVKLFFNTSDYGNQSWNGIEDEGALALSEVLRSNRTLVSLSLG